MILVGIDPGASTGLVALQCYGLTTFGAKLVYHTVVRPSQSKKLTEPMADGNMQERLYELLAQWAPDIVVLEEPVDASIAWRGRKHQQTGTAFRLGAYYGLAVSAAYRTKADLFSYPVQRQGKRQGWMGRSKRTYVLQRTVLAARALGADPDFLALKDNGEYAHEHELMALGVLLHHLNQYRSAAA